MKPVQVAVVDYGAGNLRSVAKALEYLGAEPVVTSDPDALAKAQAIILPGQGACDSAMRALEGLDLVEPVRQAIRGGVPFFGVCLGLQLLFDMSEEGDVECLGLLPGRVRLLDDGLKVPHMGWSSISLQTDHPVFEGVPQGSYFYFVHSYYPEPDDAGVAAATTSYGRTFCCAVAQGTMMATQFHPEKSGRWGLRLYENFLRFARQRAS